MATSLDGTLAALGEPTRREVVDLLRVRPRAAGELATALGMSAPAMSRHLRVLRLNGLVTEQHAQPEDARLRVYQLCEAPFAQLHDWAAQMRSLWSDQLENFKKHAEAGRKGKR